MSISTELFQQKNFWLAYTGIDGTEFDAESLQFFEQTIDDDEEYYSARIDLSVSESYTLLLELDLGFEDSIDIDLSLENLETDQEFEMGWWDAARWHPFALRWDELSKLHHHWQHSTEFELPPEVAFLLLSIFVGHGVSELEQYPQRKAMLQQQYESLGLFSPSELKKLVKSSFRLPTEPDYEWTEQNELGWTFSGEYPCYSIRNESHLYGEEGEFPFPEWATLMESLQDSEG